jgi:phytoene synthase
VTSVDQAYAEVGRLTRARARNFAWGIMVLPKEKRQAISAIYAFAREVDDIADGELPDEEKRRLLGDMHAKLDLPSDKVSQGRVEAMWVALADARARFPIPAQALHDLVDGGLIDLGKHRYATFDELRDYCSHVAGAVGVACVGVYGSDEHARAETLGIALQLINIMRDVREDWELGRVYLPQDELARFGVAEDDIAVGRVTAEWAALMRHHADRARAYLSEGLSLLAYLDRRSAACVATFARLYEATLERIEAVGFDVFEGPPRLPPLTKARIVGRSLLR